MYLSDILKQARFMTNLIAKISRCITAPFIATMRCHNHYLTFLRVLRFRNYPRMYTVLQKNISFTH